MQRYFIPPEHFRGDRVIVTGDDAHHLVRVMRAGVGYTFICSDGDGREAVARISHVGADAVEAMIIEERTAANEPAVAVWIAQSLPKGDKMDAVVQKCTEIGAVRFVPFYSELTIVQYDAGKAAKRTERWRKIAKEAAEQAHRNRVPVIDAPLAFSALLQRIKDTSFDLALVCFEREYGTGLRQALAGAERGQAAAHGDRHGEPYGERHGEPLGEPYGEPHGEPHERHGDASDRRPPESVLVVVGPEGGFTDAEVRELEAAGCRPVSLGPRILRTETAAMAALTCILYEYGEMGR